MKPAWKVSDWIMQSQLLSTPTVRTQPRLAETEEALKTLELAITAVPAYWVVAEHDDRFVPLGDAVPAL